MNNKLLILIGLPGSGKSTFTQEELYDHGENKMFQNAECYTKDNTIVLSSDEIRIELFNELKQTDNELVFKTMNERCKNALKQGLHVVYDATNVNRKRRKTLINEMKRHCSIVSCICFICNYDTILERNLTRGEKQVPEYALARMLKNFQMPLFEEGYQEIIYYNAGTKPTYLNLNEDYFSNHSPLKDLKTKFKALTYSIPEDLLIYDQNNKHHNETLGKHIISVITECYFNTKELKEYDRIILLLSAFYHDLGKPFCQDMKDGNATYYNHANVSTYYMVCDYIAGLNGSFKFIDIGNFVLLDMIQLVEYHDCMFSFENAEHARSKMTTKIGERLWLMLEILNNADRYRPQEEGE